MGVDELVSQLATEWSVITSAPVISSAVLIAIGYVIWRFSKWWHSHELEQANATIRSKEADLKLTEKQRDLAKTEADNLRQRIEKYETTPPQLIPVLYGNATVKDLFAQVTSLPSVPVGLVARMPEWADDEFAKFAAFQRLRDAGLVKFEPPSPGIITNVTSTSTAQTLQPTYDALTKKSS